MTMSATDYFYLLSVLFDEISKTLALIGRKPDEILVKAVPITQMGMSITSQTLVLTWPVSPHSVQVSIPDIKNSTPVFRFYDTDTATPTSIDLCGWWGKHREEVSSDTDLVRYMGSVIVSYLNDSSSLVPDKVNSDITNLLQMWRDPKNDNVPPGLRLACEEINKQWFCGDSSAKIEPYILRTDWDDWRIRLIDLKTKKVVSEYLTPKALSGHTLHLLLMTYRDTHKDGIQEGLLLAAKRYMGQLCDALGINQKHLLQNEKKE